MYIPPPKPKHIVYYVIHKHPDGQVSIELIGVEKHAVMIGPGNSLSGYEPAILSYMVTRGYSIKNTELKMLCETEEWD